MKTPNILLITTDQQRFDATEITGPSYLRTPHYRHLVNEGIHFTSAYTDCPICVPSRVTIMTGQTAITHGCGQNYQTSDHIDDSRSLPTLVRQCGYQTAAIGKMHFGPERARHGFDEMILPADYYIEMRNRGFEQQPMRHGLGQNEFYPTMATVPESQTLTSWIAEQSVSYIQERKDPNKPFFMWTSFSKPHPPLDPPEPYYSMYRDEDIDDPVQSEWSRSTDCPNYILEHRLRMRADELSPETIMAARAAYYGLITQVDYNMGRIFGALLEAGELDNTLIIYTSDHGEMLGDHGLVSKGIGYEASSHVPFVMRLPRTWENRCYGETVEAPISLPDILPTVLSAAGASELPDKLDGQDLIALARGELEEPRKYVDLNYQYDIDQTYYLGLTDGKYKYLYYFEGGVEQLFDLTTDPNEEHPIIDQPELIASFRKELTRREIKRGGKFLDESGKLLSNPARAEIDEKDIRNWTWPGYCMEHGDADTRH